MKYKTLFRVLLKLIGIWFALQGAMGVIHQSAIPIAGAISGIRFGGDFVLHVSTIVSFAPQVGIGLYLFFGGEWIVNLAIPNNRPYCQECGYDLSHAEKERCPECGTPFRLEDVNPAHEPDNDDQQL